MDELIIVYRDRFLEADMPISPPDSARGEANRIAKSADVSFTPIFPEAANPAGLVESRSREAACYASAILPASEALLLAERLRALPEIDAAYVRLQPENPVAPFDERDRPPSSLFAELPRGGTIPDFRADQGYRAASPGGVDADFAWKRLGGRGEGVKLIDIEGGWCLTHDDLQPNEGVFAGTELPGALWRDHGTAVLGILAGSDNVAGVSGIAPAALKGAVSHGNLGASRAIEKASEHLHAGDIMLLEMHEAGPRFNFTRRDDQRGYIAMEWWPDIFLAIRRAVDRGIIVVEAAGNGGEDLDDPFYDSPHPHFPSQWRNPFRREHDSGAIIVGAGAPPNERFGPDRSRLHFSNFGARVDCQGWGRSVVTAGYGDLFEGSGEDQWFTSSFSGTSSATPIVAGAIACLQGIATHGGRRLTPSQMRDLLHVTGALQQDGLSGPASQHIGRRPDLVALIQQASL